MKVRYAAWGFAFVALVVGAWLALQPPQLPDVPPNSAPSVPSAEARAAAMPTASRLGSSAVLSIDPRGAGARGGAATRTLRTGLWNDYLAAKSYKGIYDRLNGSPEGETPEGKYVLYDILRKCATVTERTNRQPIVRTSEQRRDQFIASIPANDPQRDKRIAAFEDVALNRCAGLEGVQITQASLNAMLASAAAGGDPKAQALT